VNEREKKRGKEKGGKKETGEKERKIDEKFKLSYSRALCDLTCATCEISAEYPARDISDEGAAGEERGGKSEG